MNDSITIDRIVLDLDCCTIHRGQKSTVSSVIASGLMSDVLTTDREEILLVSNLSTSQVVRTADMVNASAILVTNGKPIMGDTSDLARELDITLLTTELPLFEACCELGKIVTGN
jgi:hypothetical protein